MCPLTNITLPLKDLSVLSEPRHCPYDPRTNISAVEKRFFQKRYCLFSLPTWDGPLDQIAIHARLCRRTCWEQLEENRDVLEQVHVGVVEREFSNDGPRVDVQPLIVFQILKVRTYVKSIVFFTISQLSAKKSHLNFARTRLPL